MSWDWQFTPSCTPTTTVFDIDAQHNNHSNFDTNAHNTPNNLVTGTPNHNSNNLAHHSNAATPTQAHFHDAFPNYAYAHHKRDSVASTATATSIDSNPHYVAYPQVQHHHQQQHQPQSYQPYDYASTPLFVQGPGQPQGFQIQTPPPTRGSSIKPRPQRLDSATAYPATALRQPDFDTSTFSFTAPQHAMDSWSQSSGPLSAPLSAPAWTANQEDPFSHWSTQTPQSSQPTLASQPSLSHLPPQSSAPSRPVITRSTSSNNVPYTTPTAAKKPSVPSSVDPTNVYSSPVRSHFPKIPQPRPVSPEKPSLAPAFPSTSGPASPTKSGGLQRSKTIAGFLRPSPKIVSQARDAATSVAPSTSNANLPRRSSPLKRIARGSLSSIAETSRPQIRTSVVLTIDANGTARTETRVIEESPSQSNKDSQSIKEKYPNLWDDSDSDSDSTSDNKWPSRHDSLAHANANTGQERSAKVARLDTSSDNLEMAQLPRSNSMASLKTPCKAAYAAAIQLRRQSSAKKQQRPSSVQSRRNTLSSLNSSFENLAAMDLNKDEMHTKTDAGSALRQAAAHRVSPSGRQIRHLPERDQTDNATVQTVRVARSDTLPSGASRPRQLSQPQRPHQLQQVQQTNQAQQIQPPQPPPQQIQQPQPQRPQPMQQVHHLQQQQQQPLSNQIYPHTHAKSHSVSYPTATSTAPVFDPRGSFTMAYAPVPFTSAPPPQLFTNDMSSMTRCICQIPFDDGKLVRCNLCAMYSHSGCVGLDPTQHAYVCSFCASANHVSYGHPVRSSSMQNFNTWSVPGL
ncbi:hypothetical protein E4T51_00625 [Aureobasidium sp. EXF-12344]|nr:hypothetical protein E4T51_00625 [Aureobasidium sp. EXF-12344]